ncbi:TetR/AcrR family transcriptional regulator [Plantibacter sp. YIM 135249]|uniref:TetR/AcrR family transcriptional regulator n=1 Tax=Plantibacter sp. YIM 135249 TaxID=3423918 RepID=UPI003D32D8D5
MDARQRKTRARLATTILELATTRRASDISVSEIAERAGINRSTFYQHAATPADLLESVLVEELDALDIAPLGDVSPEQAALAITEVTIATIHHIEQRADVYRVGLSEESSGASLQPMLNRRFAVAILDMFTQGVITIPEDEDLSPAARALFPATASAFIAAGAVAAIRVWLETPAPRDVTVFLEVYRRLMPSWWPTPCPVTVSELVASIANGD